MRIYTHYKYISVKHLITLAKLINSGSSDKPRKRGRPPKYSEEFIIFLFLLMSARRFSYRVLRMECEDLLGKKAPVLSTLHYKFKKLNKERPRTMVTTLAALIEQKLKGVEKVYTFCDGTGFGFDEKIFLSYSRGEETRQVRGYVKTVLLVAGTPMGEYVIGVNTAPSYGDERKLLLQLLQELPVSGKEYFVADALYGMSNEVLKELIERGFIPVIPVKDGVHTKIRSPVRKLVSEIYSKLPSVYIQRYRVEQVIGKLKNSYGASISAKTYDMAVKRAIAKIVLLNYCFLMAITSIKPGLLIYFLALVLNKIPKNMKKH